MKLVSYTPSVPKTAGGSARVEAPDAQALYNIGNMQAKGLGGFVRGVNAALGVMQKQAEEKEMTNVTAAQTEYAKRVSDMLYNEENGLMNRQLANADGVSLAYQDGERKIREDVQKQFNLSGKGLNAFNVACNRDSAGHWGRLNQYEFNEGQKNKKIVTDNALLQISNEAQTLYNDVSMMNDALGKMRATIDANYFNMGKDYCDAYFRQSASNLVTSSLNVAVRKNDMAGADVIMNKFGYLVPPSQLSTYAKAVREYVKENQEIANTQRLYQKYGNNIRGAFGEIQREANLNDGEIVFPQGGSIADQAMAAALYVERKSKGHIPAALVYGQWYHETGGFTSQLTRENMNLGGLTQPEFNGAENKQPDGGNYYKMYGSLQEYADDYMKSFIDLYDYTGKDIKTPADWARLLKENGYYEGHGNSEEERIANYAAGIAEGMKHFKPDAVLIQNDASSVKKREDAYLALVAREKRIKGMEQDAAANQAWEMYYAAGPNADPRAIAQQVGGTDIVLTNTIAEMLSQKKYSSGKKGMDAAGIDAITRMMQYGDSFNSVTEVTAFAQKHGANAEQVAKLTDLWKQKINGEGVFKYPQLDKYIAAQIQNEDTQQGKARSILLRQYAIDYINNFRRDNKRDPNIEELQRALTEEFTNKKMMYEADGVKVTFTPTDLTPKGIVSADPAPEAPGMMRVQYRDDNNPGRSNVVYMPIRQFAEEIGQAPGASNPWTGDFENSDNEPDTLNSGT